MNAEEKKTAIQRHREEMRRVRKILKKADGCLKRDMTKYLKRLERELYEYHQWYTAR